MKKEDRNKYAIYVGDKDSCFKAHALLPHNHVFPVTLEWLRSGEPKYKYLIFETEQWFGWDSLEILEVRSDGTWFERILTEIKL